MGDFDDLKEMEKLVDELPDEFPADQLPQPDEQKAEDSNEEPQPAEPVTTMEPEEPTTGGLGETLAPPEGPPSIDELLGLEKKAPRGETKPEQDAQPPAEEQQAPTTPEAEPEPSGRYDRIQELAEQNKRLQEQNDALVKRMLREDQQPPVEAEEAPEIDQEAVEYLDPIVNHLVSQKLGKEVEKLRQDVQPMIDKAYDQELGEFISKRVPGFKPENVSVLRQELKNMSDEDRAIYGDRLPGAILLAKELQERGTFAAPRRSNQQQVSPRAARHHSESTDVTQGDPGELSEQAKIDRLNSLSDEEVLAHLERLEGYDT